MTIGKKLGTLVLLAMAGLLLSGVLGWLNLGQMRKGVDEINRKSVPELLVMADMTDHFKEIRALLLALVMEEDSDLRDGFAQKIADEVQGLNAGVKEYEVLGGKKDAQVSPLSGAYIAAVQAAIKIAAAGQKDEAQAELYTKVIPAEALLGKALAQEQQALVLRQKELDQSMAAGSRKAALYYIALMVVMQVLVGGMGWLLYRSIMTPLSAMQKTMRDVVRDMDFRIRAPKTTHDELGVAVDSFNALLDGMQSSLREVAAAVNVLGSEAERLAGASNEIRHVSAQSSEAAASVAGTVEELTVSINMIAERTRDAQTETAASGTRAREGGQTIQNTIEQVRAVADVVHAASDEIRKLQAQTGNISSVVSVIREVADQTNLLALNAAIEAARAGEQGRGFAVVADEVRKLAERTAQSTQEIANLIGGIQLGAKGAVDVMEEVVKKVQAGAANAGEAIDAIDAIRLSTDNVQSTVSEISHSIHEQNQASTVIAGEMERLSSISEEASHAVGQTSNSASELQALSGRLQQIVGRYRI